MSYEGVGNLSLNKMKTKFLFLTLVFVSAFHSTLFGQSRITSIKAKAFFNQKGIFSNDIVGKTTSDSYSVIDGTPQPSEQTLIIVEIVKAPLLGGPTRSLKLTATLQGKVVLQQQKEIAFAGDKYQTLFLLNHDATEVMVTAELFENGKLISTMKKKLLNWAGD